MDQSSLPNEFSCYHYIYETHFKIAWRKIEGIACCIRNSLERCGQTSGCQSNSHIPHIKWFWRWYFYSACMTQLLRTILYRGAYTFTKIRSSTSPLCYRSLEKCSHRMAQTLATGIQNRDRTDH